MENYCPDHSQLMRSIGEIEVSLKWLVDEVRSVNGQMMTHKKEGDEIYRPQVEANSRFRKGFIKVLALFIPTGGLIYIIILAILRLAK